MTPQKTGPETQAQALTTRWKEREEKIATAEILADLAEEAGVEDVLTGAEDLAAAGELEDASKEALVAGVVPVEEEEE